MKKGDFRIFSGYIARFEGTIRSHNGNYLNQLTLLYSTGNAVSGDYFGCGRPLTLAFLLNKERLCKDKIFLKEALEFLVLT